MNLVDILAIIKEKSESLSFKVSFDPNKKVADHNEVLIGLGRSSDDHQGICLNHKGTPYHSVSEMLFQVEESTLVRWHQLVEGKPEQAHFYLEDLSPDTCLSFILFIARMSGVASECISPLWIDYVNRWEAGDVKTTGEPFQSWGCLHNALAHTYLFGNDETRLTGFSICIALDLQLLNEGVDPANVTPLGYSEEYNRAKVLLQQEYQDYLYALKHAVTVQLELPIRHSNRKLMVDAFIATEKKHRGVLKAFLRNDHEHTWLKSGFGLMALYRPESKGTGNDIVISVDPAHQTHLKELWLELERLENTAWQGERPSDNPRFPERSHANEPWYDEMGKCSLVAAPKMIDESTHGSKLDWETVLSKVWELYNPAMAYKVVPYTVDERSVSPCFIHECPPMVVNDTLNRRFIAMKWDDDNIQQSLIVSPTMKRYLAACAAGNPTGSIPAVNRLPLDLSFDYLELPGGLAIVHENGILVMNDWHVDELNVDDYLCEYNHVIKRVETIKKIHKVVVEKVNDIRRRLKDNTLLSGSDLMMLNHWIAEHKLELRQTILGTMVTSKDYHVQQFRQTMERRWGLNTQLEELYNTVAELENTVKSYAETRTNRLINGITIFGFPFALFAGLFGFVLEKLPGKEWLGIHWVGLALYIILSLTSIVIISTILKRRNRYFTPYEKEERWRND